MALHGKRRRRGARRAGRAANSSLINAQGGVGGSKVAGFTSGVNPRANRFPVPTRPEVAQGILNQSVRPGSPVSSVDALSVLKGGAPVSGIDFMSHIPGVATGIAGNFPTPSTQIPNISPFRRSLRRRRRPV